MTLTFLAAVLFCVGLFIIGVAFWMIELLHTENEELRYRIDFGPRDCECRKADPTSIDIMETLSKGVKVKIDYEEDRTERDYGTKAEMQQRLKDFSKQMNELIERGFE